MRYHVFWILLIGIVLLPGWPAAGQTNLQSISGLIAQNGAGIGDVMIALSGPKADTTISNDAGEYTFSDLPVGEYTLTPFSDRFTFNPQQYNFTLSSGPTNTLPIFEAAVATANASDQLPRQTLLYPNAPNPFIDYTTIRFELGYTTPVKLDVFDLLGLQIQTLVDAQQYQPGQYEIRFMPGALPSGLYFYRLSTNTERITRPMIRGK